MGGSGLLRIILFVGAIIFIVWGLRYLWRKRAINPLALYEEYIRYCLNKGEVTEDDWQRLEQIERKSGMPPHQFAVLRDRYHIHRPGKLD